MPRPKAKMPKYRHRKVSDQAIVTPGGKDIDLCPHVSLESHAKHLSLVNEYQRNGQRAVDRLSD